MTEAAAVGRLNAPVTPGNGGGFGPSCRAGPSSALSPSCAVARGARATSAARGYAVSESFSSIGSPRELNPKRQDSKRRSILLPLHAATRSPDTKDVTLTANSAIASGFPKSALVPTEARVGASQASAEFDGLDTPPGELSAPVSSLDRIENHAKASLAKLRHLLYKLKTRPAGDIRSSLVAEPQRMEGDAAALVEEETQVLVSQKIEVNLSADQEGSNSRDEPVLRTELSRGAQCALDVASLDAASLERGLELQLDALTCTRATVTFDELRQTATITVKATVRAAEIANPGSYSERAIAMAAHALARACLELDEKAQAAAVSSAIAAAAAAAVVGAGAVGRALNSSADSPPLESAWPSSAALRDSPAHRAVLQVLATGHVVSSEIAGPQFGCTPFRPVFVVKLVTSAGQIARALFKPITPGDPWLRWARIPDDLVAYKVASLLQVDVVPPAVVRNGLEVGGRRYSSGVLVFLPEQLRPTSKKDLQGDDALLCDLRILDAILGNALRKRASLALVDSHWSGGAGLAVLGNPMGPAKGRGLNSMWTSGGGRHIQVVSSGTLERLTALSRGALFEAFGGALSAEEMDAMLAKRDHIVAHFGSLARSQGWDSVQA